MGILSALNPINAIGKTVGGIVESIAGNKAERDAGKHAENIALIGQYASEFGHAKTWWDSLIDGLNRLPRPAMALGVIGLLVYCPIDPIHFAEIMQAYALVPEWLAWVLGAIVSFYFAARHMEKRLKFKGPDPDSVKAFVEAKEKLDGLRPNISDRDYREEMADTSKPLSNAAIMRWNQRRNK